MSDNEQRGSSVVEQDAHNALRCSLISLHAQILSDPTNPKPFHEAYKVISAAASDDVISPECATLDDTLVDIIRLLVLQDKCPERPRILHHGIASLLTSRNELTARKIVHICIAALGSLPEKIEDTPLGLVLFLIIAREVMPRDGPEKKRISELHLAFFSKFDAGDLALPYSVKFNEAYFGANQKDLMVRFPSAAAALVEAKLGLRHLLLLERLGSEPIFGQTKGAEVLIECITDRLSRALVTRHGKDELAAARVFVLRYCEQSQGFDSRRLNELGLEPSLFRRASELYNTHPSRRQKISSSALGGRIRQAANAGVNLMIPSLRNLRRKPRVALCVSGQLRGFRAALASWRRALLPFAEFDIFVHTWENIGRASPQPYRAFLPFEGQNFCSEWRRIGTLEGYAAMEERHPTLFEALETTARIDTLTLKNLYGARQAVVEDDRAAGFTAFSNQDKMHYKIEQCYNLVRKTGEDYDLIMRLRPDLAIVVAGFSWAQLQRVCCNASVIFADGTFGLHYENLMMGDQLAIGAPDVMHIYSTTYSECRKDATFEMTGFPKSLTGHVSLAQTCWLSRISVRKLPLRLGGLLEMEKLSTSRILMALEADASGRADSHDANLIAAAKRDL